MITQRLEGAVAEFSGLRRGWSCKEITVKQGFGLAQLPLVDPRTKLEKEIQDWGSCCHALLPPLIGQPERNTSHLVKKNFVHFNQETVQIASALPTSTN